MGFFIDFLKQKTPKPGREMPGYYQRALVVTQAFMIAYFLLCYFLFRWKTGQWIEMPLFMLAAMLVCIASIGKVNVRLSVLGYAAVTLIWVGWFTHYFDWGFGAQHFLIPLLMLCFFNIYETPWAKLLTLVFIVSYRVGLYTWSLHHPPVYALSNADGVIVQMTNSMTMFAIIACQFILFSSSIQATERKLRLHNQELSKEAGTDPLTQLPNRRAMLDTMDNFMKNAPNERFSVAIADIDFFKKVNDTYGHNCGDYTLKTLAALFKEKAGENYTVCRWGGEEFCFFMPNKNLDEAGAVMFDLCISVKKMPLEFGDNRFNITITIGVEEYDYMSPVDVILERADQKLYRGKISGRNQVVM